MSEAKIPLGTIRRVDNRSGYVYLGENYLPQKITDFTDSVINEIRNNKTATQIAREYGLTLNQLIRCAIKPLGMSITEIRFSDDI